MTSPLIKAYLKGRNSSIGNPVDVGPKGVAGLKRFGWQVGLAGQAAMVLCFFLPHDERRWYIYAMGAITAIVGYWHLVNAERIVEAARKAHNLTRD